MSSTKKLLTSGFYRRNVRRTSREKMPRVAVNPQLFSKGLSVPWKAWPGTMLDMASLEDIDPETWADVVSSNLKLGHATECLRVSPSCVSTLRSISEDLSNVRESDAVAKHYVTQGILDVLPSVLRQSSKQVVILGLEILGALSLNSKCINQLVVTTKEIILSLVDKLTSSDVEILTAVCHTLEDVLITPESLDLVKESLLLENLLRMLCLLADLSGKADARLSDEGENSFDEAAAERMGTLQVPKIKEKLDVQRGRKVSNGVFHKELQILADTCIRIIRTFFPVQKFKNVSRPVYLKALMILQQHWLSLLEEDQRLYNGVDPKIWNWCAKSKSRHAVASCLVLLGMEYDYFSSEAEEEKPFGIADVSTPEFREKFWERSPTLVATAMPSCLVSFSKKYNTIEKLLNNLVSGFTTCPCSSADQVDPFLYFREVEYFLGDPLLYGRDIRIVKTVTDIDVQKPIESEEHLFSGEPGCSRNRFVHPKVMVKAVMTGFSLAIKGLELRCPDIARVAEGLAKQFGQPSVGVNLYVTPPNAQGLAVHFDDHCVLVCQLQGHKSWKIFPPVQLLPRLYHCRSLDEDRLKNSTVKKVYLEEGNVLYIPRGYPHKAFCEDKSLGKSHGAGSCCEEITVPCLGSGRTSESKVAALHTCEDHLSGRNKKQRITPSSESAGGEDETPRNALYNDISVHLTFGVEVEPPFEWEGLVHIALRLWVHQRWRSLTGADSEDHIGEEQLCEALLHVAIRSVGNTDIRFRKACLIAAETTSDSRLEKPVDDTREENTGVENRVSKCGALDPLGCDSCSQSSLTYFQGLMAAVSEKISFSEALKVARNCLKNEPDEVDDVGMEWLKHIPNTDVHYKDLGNSDPIDVLHHSDLEKIACVRRFADVKAEFGQALMFHDASRVFRILLNQYRILRTKSRNGLLALHGGLS